MSRHKEFDPDQAMREAMEAFWERGYHATSVSDLLAEMKLNRGSLYGTFGDKKQLFLSALDVYERQGREALKEILDRPGSPRACLREWMTTATQRCTADRRGCMAVKAAMELAPHDKDVAAWMKRFTRRREIMVAGVIRHGQAEGEINRRVDPRAAARALISALIGVGTMGAALPGEWDVAGVVDLAMKALD